MKASTCTGAHDCTAAHHIHGCYSDARDIVGRLRCEGDLRADAADEIERLRDLLVFADGYVSVFRLGLADLYAEDCEWAQTTLRNAGCHPRGRFRV